MSDATDVEREALTDLIQSDGWRYFSKKVWEEHGGKGYFQRVDAAIKAGDMEKVKLIHGVADVVRTMLAYPEMRINWINAEQHKDKKR